MTFALGGDLPVNRLGFGAMRITGKGIWGPPDDPAEARRVLQRAIELGINLIEFWNAATRPLNRNGFGYTPQRAAREVGNLAAFFLLAPDSAAIYA